MSDKTKREYASIKDKLTNDELKEALRNCPIVRAGYVNLNNVGRDKQIIPKEQCIGCRICVKKVGEDKIKMLEW